MFLIPFFFSFFHFHRGWSKEGIRDVDGGDEAEADDVHRADGGDRGRVWPGDGAGEEEGGGVSVEFPEGEPGRGCKAGSGGLRHRPGPRPANL